MMTTLKMVYLVFDGSGCGRTWTGALIQGMRQKVMDVGAFPHAEIFPG